MKKRQKVKIKIMTMLKSWEKYKQLQEKKKKTEKKQERRKRWNDTKEIKKKY